LSDTTMREVLPMFTKKGIRAFLKCVGKGFKQEVNNLVRPALQARWLGLPPENDLWRKTLKNEPSTLLPGMAFYALPLVFDQERAVQFEERFHNCSEEVDNMLYTLVSLAIALVVSGTVPDELELADERVLLASFLH